jgi:outer membrane lipoprotein-sorting protein
MRARIVVIGMALGVGLAGTGAEAFSVAYDQKTTLGRQVMTGRVSIKDQLFRNDMSEGGQQMAIIRNATGTYNYMPAENMAMKLSALNPTQRPLEGADNYLQYLAQRKATKVGSETVDGHPCDIYTYTDPDTGDAVKAWVWVRKKFPVKLEMSGAKGTIVMEFQNIEIGASIPDSHFELPPNVQVMDMGNLFGGFGQ